MDSRAVDSLLNFETVKYYNAECFEVEQYSKAIREYQEMEWKSEMTMNLLDTIQNGIIQAGLLIGCCLCMKRIADKQMAVGQFVLYISYLTQLYGPLNW
jgi:ATP-binding cassette subfamily B (MDR/TAP) protein 6